MRRFIPCSVGVAGLLLIAAVLWLPSGLGARLQSDSVPEPPSKDMQLVAGECPFFVTFRPADFTGDDLIKTIAQDLPKEMERDFGLPLSEVDRVTLAATRGGQILIVRTRKAYDAEKIREPLARRQPRFDKKDGARDEKVALSEKKAGGKVIYYTGGLSPWTEGVCSYDKTTFLRGEVNALEKLLESKGKPTEKMSQALSLANKHSLVLALDGKKLRTLIKQQREGREKEFKEMRKDLDKDKGFPKDKFREEKQFDRDGRDQIQEIAFRADDKVKAEDDDLDQLFERGFGPGRFEMLIFKPFLKAEFGLLTVDIKKTYTAAARIDFKNKDDLEDGETMLKSFLYAVREMAVMLPREEFGEFRGMKALTVPIQKATRAVKIERKDNTLNATLTVTPEAGLAKKVGEGMAEERKRQDGFRDRKVDKRKFEDKDGRFDDKDKKKE